MRVLLRADVVPGDLGARQHQQAVEAPRADRFLSNFPEVVGKGFFGHGIAAAAEGRDARHPREQIVFAQDVIGDRDHVERPGLTIEIDQLPDAQTPVAPGGVSMEIAQQERFVSGHLRV